jgi:MFS family permease
VATLTKLLVYHICVRGYSSSRRHPRTRYRWAVLSAGAVAQASFSAFALGLPALAPALRDTYGLSLRETGLLLASVNIGLLATLLLWGLATDRHGERFVIVVGLLGAAAALAAGAFSRYLLVIVLFALAGALGSSVHAGTGRAVMRWFAADERGLAMGIRQTAIPVAGAAAAVSLPWIAAAHSVRAAILVLAAGLLAGALVAAAVMTAEDVAPEPADEGIRSMLLNRLLWRLSLGSVLVCSAQVSLVMFLVLFLHDARGLSPAQAALALAASQVVGAALRIATGIWSDRVGSRITPFRQLALALAATLATAVALLHAPLAALIPLLVLATAISMGWNTLSFAAAAELGGTHRSGAALGLQQTTLAVATVAIPLLFASLVASSSWRVAYGAAAVFPLLGWWVLRPLRERH